MKIAVLEPFPRMCGVTKWTFEVVHGFRTLGHQTDVVSFSKSGRTRITYKKRRFDGSITSGWHWWPEAPGIQAKWTDAVDVLNGYDLIVLNEPKNATLDREARKQKLEVPEYVSTLRNVTAPWMTILHAPQYGDTAAPFLASMMECPSFTGFAIEHQPGSYDSGAWAFAGHVKKIQPWPWLPYRRVDAQPYDSVKREWVISIGGRFVTNKGHHMFAYLADRFPAYYKARIFGAESGGLGPASSYEVYEALSRHHGWKGERIGPPDETPDELNNRSDKIQCWPWWLSKVDEQGSTHVLEYTSGYDDPVREWLRTAIAVNMTSRNFAVGLEYTSLEAMDAGCAIVLPAYSLERTGSEQYQVHALARFATPLTIGKNGMRTHLSDGTHESDVVGAVWDADTAIRQGMHDPAVNWAAIDHYHDPQHLARAIVEGVQ